MAKDGDDSRLGALLWVLLFVGLPTLALLGVFGGGGDSQPSQHQAPAVQTCGEVDPGGTPVIC